MSTSWRIKKEIKLNQSPERVFDYLIHWDCVAEWDPSVIKAHPLNDGPPRVGSRYRITIRFAFQRVDMIYEIKDMVPNRSIVLIGKGRRFQVTDRIQLKRTTSGSRLTYRVEVTFDHARNRVSDGFARRVFDTYADKSIARLRRMLNGSRRPPKVNPINRMADKAILPGMVGFTRMGAILSSHHRPVASVLYKGRIIVLTGGTSGIGRAAARMLFTRGAHLVVVGRDAAKLAQLRRELASLRKGGSVETELADLSLMADVRRLASRLVEKYERIDVLINNAGALFNQHGQTAEGIERTLATDLISPYLLTRLLLPALKSAGAARIVNVSSGGMYTQGIRAEMLNDNPSGYDGPTAYARAKRGLVVLTALWSRAFARWNISVHAMHPGWVDTPGLAASLPAFRQWLAPVLRTAEQGADTIVWLAASPDAARASGNFWLDRKIRETIVFRNTRSTNEECLALIDELDKITGFEISPSLTQ